MKPKPKLWRILYVQPRKLNVLLADEDPVENVKQENDMVRLMVKKNHPCQYMEYRFKWLQTDEAAVTVQIRTSVMVKMEER